MSGRVNCHCEGVKRPKQSHEALENGDCHACVPKHRHFGVQARSLRSLAMTKSNEVGAVTVPT